MEERCHFGEHLQGRHGLGKDFERMALLFCGVQKMLRIGIA